MTELATPTIHLNGTSAESLLEQQRAVYEACEALIAALSAAHPHGRDYYVQGGEQPYGEPFLRADAQNRARIRAVVGVREETSKIVNAIFDQAKD